MSPDPRTKTLDLADILRPIAPAIHAAEAATHCLAAATAAVAAAADARR